MGVLVIRCPQTGREIPTGFEMDAAEFQRAPVFFSRVQCPGLQSRTRMVRQGRMGDNSDETGASALDTLSVGGE